MRAERGVPLLVNVLFDSPVAAAAYHRRLGSQGCAYSIDMDIFTRKLGSCPLAADDKAQISAAVPKCR